MPLIKLTSYIIIDKYATTPCYSSVKSICFCLSVNLPFLIIAYNHICHWCQWQMLISFNHTGSAHCPWGIDMLRLNAVQFVWSVCHSQWMNEWMVCPHCCWGLWGRPSSGGGGRPGQSGPASRTGGLWWSHTCPGSSRIGRTSSRRWSASGQGFENRVDTLSDRMGVFLGNSLGNDPRYINAY